MVLRLQLKPDTATGHFEVHNYNTDLEEEENFTPAVKTNKFDTDVDKYDKADVKKSIRP